MRVAKTVAFIGTYAAIVPTLTDCRSEELNGGRHCSRLVQGMGRHLVLEAFSRAGIVRNQSMFLFFCVCKYCIGARLS